MQTAITIKTKKSSSRWVAIDAKNKVITEGMTPESVRKRAIKITDNFVLAFVHRHDVTYVL
jgi:hypothetical protein